MGRQAGRQGGQQQDQTRPPMASSICYCCGDVGHFARNCPFREGAVCGFCKKVGHIDKACWYKPRATGNSGEGAAGSGDGNSGATIGEANFFYGESGECNVVDFKFQLSLAVCQHV